MRLYLHDMNALPRSSAADRYWHRHRLSTAWLWLVVIAAMAAYVWINHLFGKLYAIEEAEETPEPQDEDPALTAQRDADALALELQRVAELRWAPEHIDYPTHVGPPAIPFPGEHRRAPVVDPDQPHGSGA